ncbi:MAG: SLBB domain-containing protein [Limisphaerales bacterium]
MGQFQILVIFFVWVVSVMGQPAAPVPPIHGNIRPQITNLVPLPSGNQFGAGVTNQFGAGVTNQFGAGVTNQFVEPLPENEFQRFVTETTGQKLPLFGRQLFTPRTAQFLPEHNLPVTVDYIIGTGDELLIRAWGNLDINLQLTVDRDGAINIPQVGVLQVAGMKASQVEGFIKAQVGRLFQNFEMNVTFGRLRSIKVLVVGHARKPGNYSVSSLSTAMSALFKAGGPSAVGSMRKIEVKRGGEVLTELDLYELLLEGDSSNDVRLAHGDIIRVLPMGSLVAVSGSVQVPAVYEMKGAEKIKDVFEYAGGLTATAFKGRASLERIQDHTSRRLTELKLDAEGLAVSVQNGDVITVEPISPQFDQIVSLRGHVDTPRRYTWNRGMRITDLIPRTSYLIPREYWGRVNQLTESEEEGGDESRDPAELTRRLLNEVNWQYATITRLDLNSLSNELVVFNLGAAIRGNDPEENHILKSGDVVTIYSKNDVGVPKALKDNLVTLRGEFANPGVYKVRTGETLAGLVGRAGGFTSDAYVYASVFTRSSVRFEQQKRLDEGIARVEKELTQVSARMQARTLDREVKDSLEAQTTARAKSIETMRNTVATGRITLKIKRDFTQKDLLPNIELQDGDVFFVPSRTSEVHVMGEVYNQQSSIWNRANTVLDVMAGAGGPTRHADMKQLFVIRANGTVESLSQTGKRFIHKPMYPGDTLVVPEQLDYANWKYEIKEWVKIFSDFAIGAAAIRVLSRD